MGSGDLNLDPPTCAASTSLTDPTPSQPFYYYYFFFEPSLVLNLWHSSPRLLISGITDMYTNPWKIFFFQILGVTNKYSQEELIFLSFAPMHTCTKAFSTYSDCSKCILVAEREWDSIKPQHFGGMPLENWHTRSLLSFLLKSLFSAFVFCISPSFFLTEDHLTLWNLHRDRQGTFWP